MSKRIRFQRRLTEKEAEFLGLQPKPPVPGNNPRYELSAEQEEQLMVLRKGKVSSADFDIKTGTTTETNGYPETDGRFFMVHAWGDDGRVMDFPEYCEKYNFPIDKVHSWKLVSHTGTPYYNIAFIPEYRQKEQQLYNEDLLAEVFAKALASSPVRPPKPSKTISEDLLVIDRLILTDTHVGMDPNPEETGLYSIEWPEAEMIDRTNKTIDYAIANKRGNTLLVDDLADFTDGYDGKTARKEHSLRQNMGTEEQFRVALDLKMLQLDRLAMAYDFVTFTNCCVDNHNGRLAYLVNHAFKVVAEAKYQNVRVNNFKKFMDFYLVPGHAFVLCHGKDEKEMKYGMKPKADDKTIRQIDNYMTHHELYKKAARVHFCKGDSHQAIFDAASSSEFDYNNYPPFCPASTYVQVNYGTGRSGATLEHVECFEPYTISRQVLWF